MKTQQEYIEQGEQYILKTYNRFPVVLEKGEGVYLYDADQKKYLDFASEAAEPGTTAGGEPSHQSSKLPGTLCRRSRMRLFFTEGLRSAYRKEAD